MSLKFDVDLILSSLQAFMEKVSDSVVDIGFQRSVSTGPTQLTVNHSGMCVMVLVTFLVQ